MTIDESIEILEYLSECSYVDKFEDEEKEALELAIHELKKYSDCNLTDDEQRIFLAAMDREHEVCKVIDKNNRLTFICDQITRKAKRALF